MAPRIRFVVASLLFALACAGLEVASILIERPWPAALAWRAARETAGLWLAASLALALLRVATSGRTPPRAAFAVAPLAFGVAWLLARLDPVGRLDAKLVALVGVLAVAGALALAHAAARACAHWRLPEDGAWPWAAPLALLLLAAGGDALAWRRAQRPLVAPPASPPPNLLLISIDTCRADRLGAYGSSAGLTPHLDDFARESVVVEDATAPMPVTGPSHAALLTGLAPHESGVRRNGVALAPSLAALPELLAAQGYVTAAFVSALPMASRALGLAPRFHLYDDELDLRAPLAEPVRARPFGSVVLRLLRTPLPWREALRRDGRETLARARDWIEESAAAPRAPFFALVHLYDLHAPYAPHRAGASASRLFTDVAPAARLALLDDPADRRRLLDLYDGDVEYVDALLGPFLERVRALGLFDRTLVVVTADHGESLGEHGRFADHVAPNYVETHVPLLVRLPKGELGGRRVAGPAQLQDLPATLRDLLGISIAVPGASLAGSLKSGPIPTRRLFAASSRNRDDGSCTVAVRDGRFQLLRESAAFDRAASRLVPASERLYDTQADPLETHDLLGSGDEPEELASWRAALDAFAKTLASESESATERHLEDELGRLGYAR